MTDTEIMVLEDMPQKENLLERITPFELRGEEILEKVQSMEIKDSLDTAPVRAIMKEAQLLSWQVEDIRKYIVAPFNKQVKVINAIAKKIATPIEEAKKIAKDKIVAWEDEQERLRKAEEPRVMQICSAVRNTKTRSELTEKITKIEENWYIGNADVLLAVNAMYKKFEEEERLAQEEQKRKEEAERLAKIRAEQDAEAVKLEEQRIENERKQRVLDEESARQKALAQEQELLREKQEQSEILDIDKKLNTTKWVRKTMSFEVLDESIVPREYCSPDESLIREAVKNNVTEIPWVKIFLKTSVQ